MIIGIIVTPDMLGTGTPTGIALKEPFKWVTEAAEGWHLFTADGDAKVLLESLCVDDVTHEGLTLTLGLTSKDQDGVDNSPRLYGVLYWNGISVEHLQEEIRKVYTLLADRGLGHHPLHIYPRYE